MKIMWIHTNLACERKQFWNLVYGINYGVKPFFIGFAEKKERRRI